MAKARLKNEGLKKQEEQRKKDTQDKILKAIDKLKKSNKKLSISAIANEAKITRSTAYSHKDFIQENSSLKVVKNADVLKLEELNKELKSKNRKLLDENKEYKEKNQNLVEQIMVLTQYIEELEKK